MDDSRLLKITEVARILAVSRTQAYRLAQSGQLPSVRFGAGTVRVKPADLEKFIDDHTISMETPETPETPAPTSWPAPAGREYTRQRR